MNQPSCVSGATSEMRRVEDVSPWQALIKGPITVREGTSDTLKLTKGASTVLTSVGLVASLLVIPASLVDSKLVVVFENGILQEKINATYTSLSV
jgi:hypothetical protein